jgi:hypothetical protein
MGNDVILGYGLKLDAEGAPADVNVTVWVSGAVRWCADAAWLSGTARTAHCAVRASRAGAGGW